MQEQDVGGVEAFHQETDVFRCLYEHTRNAAANNGEQCNVQLRGSM